MSRFSKLLETLGTRYKSCDDAVILIPYYNPMKSAYRLKNFMRFYKSIKHMNYRVIECVIQDSENPHSELKGLNDPNITVINTPSLLWHKESLINLMVKRLPKDTFKYVFWIDADVKFLNKNWMPEAVEKLQKCEVVQLFSMSVHMSKDEIKPKDGDKRLHSFASTYEISPTMASCSVYETHGHVGFAWGANLRVLKAVPLYDKALVGGADHIIAHAAAGDVGHPCITRTFAEDIDAVNEWSYQFNNYVHGKLGCVQGELWHFWHGDIDKRQYSARIKKFTKQIKTIEKRDRQGLYTAPVKGIKEYYRERETQPYNDGFAESAFWGYMTNNWLTGWMFGGNPMGAALGDSLNQSDVQEKSYPVENLKWNPAVEEFPIEHLQSNPYVEPCSPPVDYYKQTNAYSNPASPYFIPDEVKQPEPTIDSGPTETPWDDVITNDNEQFS